MCAWAGLVFVWIALVLSDYNRDYGMCWRGGPLIVSRDMKLHGNVIFTETPWSL